jgi:hypothetical protein
MHYFENLNFRIKEELNFLGRYIGRDEVQTVRTKIHLLLRT